MADTHCVDNEPTEQLPDLFESLDRWHGLELSIDYTDNTTVINLTHVILGFNLTESIASALLPPAQASADPFGSAFVPVARFYQASWHACARFL